MTEYIFKDWMEAPIASEGPTRQEAAIIKDYVTSLDLGVYHLPNLLRDMGPYLTQETDLITVARALAIFPHVLGGMGTELRRQETHSLVEYFCARLENPTGILNYRAGISDVASSLQILSKWKAFLPSDAATIATAVFALASGSTFKDQKPITRVKLYELIDFLYKEYEKPLIRDVKVAPLVLGLVSMAELEKNPSCLSVLFPLYSHISQKWPLEDSNFEVIWESFIRYFPVTVGGAAQDTSVPTKEILRELLLQCILSNDQYAKHAVPRFIDMMDTNTDLSANLKIEVLSTLSACVTSYSDDTISAWSSQIWDALKFEIWNGENEDFILGALNVLRAMTVSLGRNHHDWSKTDGPLTKFVIPAATECKDRFHDSKTQYMVSSGKILRSIASGSPYAFYLVAKTVLPAMHVIWQDLKLPSEKKMLLMVYNCILDARLAQPDIASISDNLHSDFQTLSLLGRSFEKFRDGVVEVYFSAVSNIRQETSSSSVPFGAPAVQGLVLLFQIPSYLSAVEQGMIVQELNTILFSPPKDDDTRTAVLSSLQKISAEEPKIFHDITLTNFIEKLPYILSQDGEGRKTELDVVARHLQDLVQITCYGPCQKELPAGPPAIISSSYWHRNFEAMEMKLLEKLDLILQQHSQLDYANTVLAAICGGLQIFDSSLNTARRKAKEPFPLDLKVNPYTNIVMELFKKVVEKKSGHGGYIGIKSQYDEKFIQLVGRTAMWALRSELTTPANNFLLNWNAFFPDEPSAIWTLFTPGMGPSLSITQQDLENAPEDKCLANTLSMYLLAGNRRTEPFNFVEETSHLRIQIADFAAAMIQNAVKSHSGNSKFSRLCMLWLLQLLVSKYAATQQPLSSSATQEKPRHLLDIMTEHVISCAEKSDWEVRNIYQTLAYYTAASITCFDQAMKPLVDMMIKGLSDSKYGRKVAQSFRILLAEFEIMNKANFCTVRALRYQKVISLVVEPLHGAFFSPQTTRSEKDNIIIALAGVFAFMDAELIADSFGFNAIILEGTGVSNDEFTKETYIRLLHDLIPHCPKMVEEHFDTVIRKMTDRTHNTYDSPSDASVRCRAKALEVLARLTEHLPVAVLIQRRARLMPELDLALDDCSRDVRVKAQQTKMKWLRLGTTQV